MPARLAPGNRQQPGLFPETEPDLSADDHRIEVDGSARNNPGPAGIGVCVLGPDGQIVRQVSRPLGSRTNNQAEYEAMLVGLEEAARLAGRPMVIQTDSELVYRQLTGKYRVRDRELKPLYLAAMARLAQLPNVRLVLVPREQNRRADKLAQAASAREATDAR